MKVWAALSQALVGWMLILRGEIGWRERFALTGPGLMTALIIFAVIAFLAVALASMSIGMPSAVGVVVAMAVLALPVIALMVSLFGTQAMLKSRERLFDMLVPGTYAMTAFLLVEGGLAMIGGPVVLLSWLGLAYLLYRLARAATGWTRGIAAGFAVLTVVLLVTMRLALYMLSSTALPPI